MNGLIKTSIMTLNASGMVSNPVVYGVSASTFSGSDIIPDPLDWLDVSYVNGGIPENNISQIDGISVPIELTINWTGAAGLVYYKTSPTSFNQYDFGVFPAQWTQISNGVPFTVNLKDFVGFTRTSAKTGSIVFTIQNYTDGGTVLDTFTHTLT